MSNTKIITGKVRFSYAHVWTPKAMEAGNDPKYSVSILIPKTDNVTVNKINAAVDAALLAGAEKFGGKPPKNFKHPLKDGDIERPDDEVYAGHYYVSASSFRQPGIVDANREDIIDKDEFYSGCYGRASINFYAFNVGVNKGIAAGLQNLQKLEDGERLGGSAASAAEDFGDDDDMM